MGQVFQSPVYPNIQHELETDGRWRPIVDGEAKEYRQASQSASAQQDAYRDCNWVEVKS